MFLELPGKVAIVTGAAQGIGYAIAERLALAGAHVVLADINEGEAKASAQRLAANATTTLAVEVDVTQPDQVQEMIARVLNTFGQIDIFVNNAGITGKDAPLWELTDQDWARVLGIDLTGVFYCCRAVIAPMRERYSGSIVNVASIAGKEGNPNLIPYSAAKAGVIALTKALAKEVVHDGIRVNCVSPGVIETPLLKQVTPEAIESLRSKIPLGRIGRPQEMAAVVHFLASDDASFVTGQCYDVSGGRATY